MRTANLLLLLLLLPLLHGATGSSSSGQWLVESIHEIKRRFENFGVVAESGEVSHARNAIIFVGDGMGLTTLTAARIFKGQRHGRIGETERLAWDEFPSLAHVKTYTANTQIPESAASATAMFTGVKTSYEVIGLDISTRLDDCTSFTFEQKLNSIFYWAQQAGMGTGVITTTRVTHATPAALYANVPYRYWEDDSKIPIHRREHCRDIALQLIESDPGRNISVILGGGRRNFRPNTGRSQRSRSGRRLDGRNLIHEWLKDKQTRGYHPAYVTTADELASVPEETDHLLGLFADSHLSYRADRPPESSTEPSLTQMVLAALKILTSKYDRYVLVVESGRIDHAHHVNNAYRALDETLVLEEAVRAALDSPLVDLSDTLVLITADHSDGLSFTGQGTPRGTSIVGVDPHPSDIDHKLYPILSYAAGPGHFNFDAQQPPRDTVQIAAIPRSWGHHSGDDVPLFAAGPLAGVLFTGTFDQTFVAHALAYALCLSVHAERCERRPKEPSTPPDEAITVFYGATEVAGAWRGNESEFEQVRAAVVGGGAGNGRKEGIFVAVFVAMNLLRVNFFGR